MLDYLTLVLSGEYDKDDFMMYPNLILEKCEKEKVDKVLVNGLNLSGTDIPTMDRYFIGENLAYLVGWKGEACGCLAERAY